jgi:hypothetical protein
MPRVVYYLTLFSGVLTLPLPFIMVYFSDHFQLGLAAVVILPISTFLAALVILWAGQRFGTEPEIDSRLQGVVFGLSIVVLTCVFGSGIWQVSLCVLSGPFLGVVASISFFVGKRESFFW